MKKGIFLAIVLSSITVSVNAQFEKFSEPMKLPGTVNQGSTEESLPVFSHDSSTLYFTRTWDPGSIGGIEDQDIWSSKRESDGSYSNVSRLSELNNKYNNAILGMNKAGNKMYLLNAYEGKKDQKKGLAVSTLDGTKWGKPEEVVIPNLDIDGDYFGFYVSPSEAEMIISTYGTGTMSNEYLYFRTKSGNTWSTPMHMGSVLNTSGFEFSPYLSRNQDTLYFSSSGHSGMGDADIFYSVKQGSWTSWSKPVNLGSKINSPKFDAYLTLSNNVVYWSSNRDSDVSDIWMARLLPPPPPLSVTCKGMDVTIYKGSDGKLDATVSGGVGPFTFVWSNGSTVEDPTGVPKGTYTVTVTDAVGQTATCSSTIGEPGPPSDIVYKHYFEYNIDEVTVQDAELKAFVTQVENFLNSGRENVTINIAASASTVPTRKFGTNFKLSSSRANTMKEELDKYFESKGLKSKVTVNSDSATVTGLKYGNDPETQEKNRAFQSC